MFLTQSSYALTDLTVFKKKTRRGNQSDAVITLRLKVFFLQEFGVTYSLAVLLIFPFYSSRCSASFPAASQSSSSCCMRAWPLQRQLCLFFRKLQNFFPAKACYDYRSKDFPLVSGSELRRPIPPLSGRHVGTQMGVKSGRRLCWHSLNQKSPVNEQLTMRWSMVSTSSSCRVHFATPGTALLLNRSAVQQGFPMMSHEWRLCILSICVAKENAVYAEEAEYSPFSDSLHLHVSSSSVRRRKFLDPGPELNILNNCFNVHTAGAPPSLG